ncbi:hypothetical protein FisN_23Lh248 [Fistulifera solaris]|uniref:Ester cyclase n=1 Tax=Fistulifera solaris TaxID=1519565 RepID=A0A1Z5JRG9_FISSO|nr:hypothetical protein FisN_23Lh248 [Fistulifera solaris]|eukprot:GAX16623.1 hypothetical protein FisN_23Lh248 [Fistulifera solaris]
MPPPPQQLLPQQHQQQQQYPPQQYAHQTPQKPVMKPPQPPHPNAARVTTTVRVPPPPRVKPETRENLAEETTPASTRDVVKKFIADIWNRGEVDLIPEICSTGLRFNGNTGFDRVGHDGLARMVGTIRDALDDYHCEIHSMVVENNKAFCRLRFTGRHTGSLLGYEPTNKIVAWMGATEFTCQNGKIVKVWELGDVKSLEEQLSNDVVED